METSEQHKTSSHGLVIILSLLLPVITATGFYAGVQHTEADLKADIRDFGKARIDTYIYECKDVTPIEPVTVTMREYLARDKSDEEEK
jgi:hypothetical protein